MTNGNDDPVVKQYRDQISDNDLRILEAINRRIKLVRQLWSYKREHDLEVYSPGREEWMLTFAARANKGPMSRDALSEIYRHVIEVTQHEVRRLDDE